MMKLYDSARRKTAPLTPVDPPRVTVYGCGPTVYDAAHIGNFRSFAVYDLLHRQLKRHSRDVTFVVNFTDVDDKTIRGAARAGTSLERYTATFVQAFLDDAKTLGIAPFSRHPRATAFVPQMTAFVMRLIENGHAYAVPEGSVYYSVPSFEGYGRLAGNRPDAEAARARVDSEGTGKRDPRDFALWKAASAEDLQVGAAWESPWGLGRPGWHLECSVMATSLLGDTIDIHLGGEDLLFPHHENEIAQSEGATGQPFVRHWLHVKHLKVEDRKMSKSLGNFHTVRELLDAGHEPAAIRWVLISAHYRSELNFTAAGLEDASASMQRLLDFRRRVASAPASGTGLGLASKARGYYDEFGRALDDDLNVPRALAALWALVRDGNTALDRTSGGFADEDREAVLEVLAAMDEVLGVLDLAAASRHVEADAERAIQQLVDDRNRARAQRDFAKADRLRDEITALGVRLEDTPEGTRWSRVHSAG